MSTPRTGIIFDNPYNTYFAGATVCGRVELALDRPKKLRGIYLELRGAARVRWTETETRHVNGKSESHTVAYYAEEEYFKMKLYCIGGPNHDVIILPPGTHVYPFSMTLPPTVPSSFEGLHGTIRYIAKFALERPWKWNQETKTAFTVVSPYDLNRFPNLLAPAKLQTDKYFCCCCCKSGPLTAVLMVPKTGYVCGERISFVVEIDNASTTSVSEVTVKFQQDITFCSQFPSRAVKKDTKVFGKMKLGSVNGKDSKTWNQMLLIPPLPPSSLGYCSIIQSEYQLFLEASTGAFHVNLRTSIPITIGTVPVITETSHREPIVPPPDYETATGVSADTAQAGWVDMPNPSAPPVQTFGANEMFNVKSIAEEHDGRDTFYGTDTKGYTPTYPVYNFGYNA
ncbi:hypothetical protein Trydic_g20415 [Trypoxylus dichotomus]